MNQASYTWTSSTDLRCPTSNPEAIYLLPSTEPHAVVFMCIYPDQSEDSSVDFLSRLKRAAPMKIVKLLTDNGSQFTDRFRNKKRRASGIHKFDVRMQSVGHRTSSVPTASPANQRHGRAFQWPDQRGTPSDALCLGSPVESHADELCEDIQPSDSPAGTQSHLACSGLETLVREKA